MAVLLVVAVVAVAYGTQSPAIGVAEFAPAARQAVEPPPTTAGDDVPAGAGRSSGRRSTTTTRPPAVSSSVPDSADAAAPTTRVARGRPCFGSPPRQLEDPQSPACMATIFEGDNGGATSTGVTGTEIDVAVPLACCEADYKAATVALFDYFNQRFELYGRRLRPVFVLGGASDPTQSRALAANVAAQQVFAALSADIEWNWYLQEAFYHELARNRVVTVARGLGKLMTDRNLFDPLHPYLWSVSTSAEDIFGNLADLACTALAAKPARHAGNAGLQVSTRKFGVLAYGHAKTPPASLLRQALTDRCAIDSAWAQVTALDDPSGSAQRTALSSLQAAGVTTVICVCEGGYDSSAVRNAATSFGYQPEWLISTSHTRNDEYTWQATTEQPLISISDEPRLLPLQAEPWFGALQSAGPALLTGAAAGNVMAMAEVLYSSLLVLAAGIQGAGPALTPDTFAAGLMAMDFPNPGAGQAPYWQPSVGFGPGDHSFHDDYAVRWWSRSAPPISRSSTSGRGAWCYLDGGARFSIGSYPANLDSRFFGSSERCR